MKTCLLAERVCGYCEAEQLYQVDIHVYTHGHTGWRRGCRCETCVEAHRERLRQERRKPAWQRKRVS